MKEIALRRVDKSSPRDGDEGVPLLGQRKVDGVMGKKKKNKKKRGFTLPCLKGNTFGITFNIVNYAVGSGFLFLPFVFKELGIVVSILLLAFGTIMARTSMEFLFQVGYKHRNNPKIRNLDSLGFFLYGAVGRFIVQMVVVFGYIATLISYVCVVADVLRGWFDDVLIHSLVLSLVVLPFVLLSMFEKIGKLTCLSYLKFLCVVVFLIMIVVSYFLGYTKNMMVGVVNYWPNFGGSSLFATLLHVVSHFGIVIASFDAHEPIVTMIKENLKKSPARISLGISLAAVIIFFTNCMISEFSYLSFVNGIQTDLILNFERNDIFSMVLRSVLGISVLLSIPLSLYSTKVHLTNFFKNIIEFMIKKKGAFQSKKGCYSWLNLSLNVVTTLMLGAIITIVSIVFPHASDIFSLMGCMFTSTTSYVIPAFVFWKEYKPKGVAFIALFVFLSFFGLFGLFGSIFELIKMIMEDELF